MTQEPIHTPQTFAAWLREQLTLRGYTDQRRFARDAGLSTATVSRLMRADGQPDIRTLSALAETLGKSLGELLVRAAVATPDDLAAAARPISLESLTPEQAAAELGITEPQAVAAFVSMVGALRPPRTDGRSASG